MRQVSLKLETGPLNDLDDPVGSSHINGIVYHYFIPHRSAVYFTLYFSICTLVFIMSS